MASNRHASVRRSIRLIVVSAALGICAVLIATNHWNTALWVLFTIVILSSRSILLFVERRRIAEKAISRYGVGNLELVLLSTVFGLAGVLTLVGVLGSRHWLGLLAIGASICFAIMVRLGVGSSVK